MKTNKIHTVLLTSILVMLISTNIYSQRKYIVKAGLNFSNMIEKDNTQIYSDSYKKRMGFHVGGIVEFSKNEMFCFESGLLFTTKGFENEEYNEVTKMNIYYLEIPANIKASFFISKIKVFGTVGPYLAMALAGNIRTEITVNNETTVNENNIKWGSGDNKDLQRYDGGLNFGAGIQVYAIMVSVSYGLGILNISPTNDDGMRIKNTNIAVSLGYKFGKYGKARRFAR